MDATVLSPAFGHIYCTKCTVSGSKTYVCTILDFFASAPTVPGAFFLEIQVIFGRVRLFLGESGYFWESQAIFGRFRLFLGDSGYYWACVLWSRCGDIQPPDSHARSWLLSGSM